MEYEVNLLKPADDFLLSLEIKIRSKAVRTIKLLQEFGPYLSEPHSKSIKGIKSLSELRVKQGSNICRFFYFHSKGKIYIVTSGFIKKDKKTSKNELKLAEKLMKNFVEETND